jgi:hypothetical protein
MAITTYAELQTAIENWLDRDDLTDRIPEFITLAEARFNRVIRAPDMLTRNDAFTVDGQYETLPTGFLEASRIALSTSPVTLLEYVTPQEMTEVRSHTRSSSGKPAYYTVTGGSFEFLPTPGSSYTASILYYAALTPLASGVNWLLTSHPDVYLFGALVEAEPYVRNDERLPLWKMRLDQSLAELNALNDRKRTPGAARPRIRGFG